MGATASRWTQELFLRIIVLYHDAHTAGSLRVLFVDSLWQYIVADSKGWGMLLSCRSLGCHEADAAW
jgi:hypothetical protein